MLRVFLLALVTLGLAACQPAERDTAAPAATTDRDGAAIQPTATDDPMTYILVRHQVEDYETWKEGFDAHSTTREASGSQGGLLFRDAENPNEVVILLRWDDMARAQAFIGSDDLRETMQRLGVSGPPDIYFLDEVDRPAK